MCSLSRYRSIFAEININKCSYYVSYELQQHSHWFDLFVYVTSGATVSWRDSVHLVLMPHRNFYICDLRRLHSATPTAPRWERTEQLTLRSCRCLVPAGILCLAAEAALPSGLLLFSGHAHRARLGSHLSVDLAGAWSPRAEPCTPQLACRNWNWKQLEE